MEQADGVTAAVGWANGTGALDQPMTLVGWRALLAALRAELLG